MVLPERIELSTSPLPRECSTTELRQRQMQAPDDRIGGMVLPERIELSTSPLPRECSTTELRQLKACASKNQRFQGRRVGKLQLRAGGHCHKA